MSVPVFGQPLPILSERQRAILRQPIPDHSRDTLAQIEGRDFLKLITEADAASIDRYEGHAIEAWLYELGYNWNGQSWVLEVTQ